MCCSGRQDRDPGVEEDADCYYHVLAVSPTATLTEITKAYHGAALLYHPDRRQQSTAGSSCCSCTTTDDEMFLRIQEAWECLRCPERRQAYDTKRRQEQIQREQRLRSALPVERDECVERIVLDLEDYNGSSSTSERVVELVFSCRCGQELLVSESDPDDHNLLTCHGCSLLYDTTPVWKEEEAGVLGDDD